MPFVERGKMERDGRFGVGGAQILASFGQVKFEAPSGTSTWT